MFVPLACQALETAARLLQCDVGIVTQAALTRKMKVMAEVLRCDRR